MKIIGHKTALIGHTGFVGHNIFLQQDDAIHLYNTSNIHEMYGKEYELIIIAAPGGSRIFANKFPGEDRIGIGALATHLNLVKGIKKVVLISTVEVYSMKNGIDEHAKIDPTQLDDYGRNRHTLEEIMLKEFDSTIIRLPILFGENLKKNFIYDLIHNERIEYINPNNELPLYNLEYLWNDILTALDNDLRLVNLVSEPINVGELAKEIFDIELPENKKLPLRKYDIWSRHANLWGSEPYIESKENVLYDLKKFVENYK
jgi:nucleoside-diphosphate-sugar epimerase